MKTLEVDSVVLGCGIVGSYIASRLRERGQRVALVDCAPPPGASLRAPRPAVVAGTRAHQGLVDARHHELGGNSAYWGGAMLRIPAVDLPGIVDTAVITPDALARAYDEVERVLGFPNPTQRTPAFPGMPALAVAQRTDACVMPARSKHFFDSLVRPHLADHAALFDVGIESIEQQGDTISSITVRGADGELTRLQGGRFFLSMGIIDSLLFARRFESTLFPCAVPALARHLHEHISVPLFKVRPHRGGDFLRTWVPHFSGAFMAVPRVEFGIEGVWNARAFIHFVYDFDSIGVYRDIKQVMAARQSGASLPTLARKAIGLAPRTLEMARIGVDRFLSKRLYVSDEVPVTAVLDFESYPHRDNRLEAGTGGAAGAMHWDIRAEDQAAFRHLMPDAYRIVDALSRRHGFSVSPLGPATSATAAELDAWLMQSGKDILHLGGGLQASGGHAVLEPDLSFPCARNLSAISTAVLARGSVVNPTHSLLALAQWSVDR